MNVKLLCKDNSRELEGLCNDGYLFGYKSLVFNVEFENQYTL